MWALYLLIMNQDKLINEISEAFAKVSLEDGIGILEAEALDLCESDKKLEKARKSDFRKKWNEIPESIIEEHYSALCFMDAKGLRFNLPAYMIFALKNWEHSASASIDAPIYALANVESEQFQEEWSIFTIEQRKAITKFLKYMVIEVPDGYVDSSQASLAYEKTWVSYDDEQI